MELSYSGVASAGRRPRVYGGMIDTDRAQPRLGRIVTLSQPAHRPRVLVVDDDPDILLMLQDVLAEEDFSVLSARDGHQALKLALGAPPDLILTDLMMPNMDGRALQAHLQAHRQTAHIPVLLMSAAGQARVGESFAAFIAKPFSIEVLLDEVHRHLS